jgi:hypothetical protein
MQTAEPRDDLFASHTPASFFVCAQTCLVEQARAKILRPRFRHYYFKRQAAGQEADGAAFDLWSKDLWFVTQCLASLAEGDTPNMAPSKRAAPRHPVVMCMLVDDAVPSIFIMSFKSHHQPYRKLEIRSPFHRA